MAAANRMFAFRCYLRSKSLPLSSPRSFWNTAMSLNITRQHTPPISLSDRPAKKAKLHSSPPEMPLDIEASTSKPDIPMKGTSKPPTKMRSNKSQTKHDKKKRRKLTELDPGSPDDVLWHEIQILLGEDVVQDAIGRSVELKAPFDFGHEMEVTIAELSSSGKSVYHELCAQY